jgi:peroxiredoxin
VSHPLIGEAAPDFTLINQAGTPITLSGLRETPVLVVFIPFAFSPLCTSEIIDLRDSGDLAPDDAVRVVTISCDSVFANRAWTDATQYKRDVLSDFWPHGAVCRAYGIFDDKAGRAVRASFLVDTGGVVRWATVNDADHVRDVGDYTGAIAAL